MRHGGVLAEIAQWSPGRGGHASTSTDTFYVESQFDAVEVLAEHMLLLEEYDRQHARVDQVVKGG